MRKILACAAAVALFTLSGCAGGALHRGYDMEGGAFVSQARPSIVVKAAEGYEPVRSGFTLCRVPYENSMIGGHSAEVWYSLSSKQDSQLAVLLAECSGGWVWSIGGHSQEYAVMRVIYEKMGVEAGSEDEHVYIRPLKMDPWLAGTPEAEQVWGNGVLVARFDRQVNADQSKLVIEYREPAPAAAEAYMPTKDEVESFLSRARAAYTASAMNGEHVQLSPAERTAPLDRLLGPVVGAAEEVRPILLDF